VFYHRVEELARKAQGLQYQILGNTMAHEIGHLLLGSTGHSPTGIMKAKWSREELQPSAIGFLVFTPQQATLIQNDVTNRVRGENPHDRPLEGHRQFRPCDPQHRPFPKQSRLRPLLRLLLFNWGSRALE
jgi:hypothetical protein